MAKKPSGINPEIEKELNRLMKEVNRDANAPLEMKLRVIDRMLKLEALKVKANDQDFGIGFLDDDDEE